LKANDVDVVSPEIHISRDGTTAAPIPTRYSLDSKPNPFNPSTRVAFTLPGSAGVVHVLLRVHDVSGRVVRTLLNANRTPGVHQVVWDGKDDRGNAVGTGVYLLKPRGLRLSAPRSCSGQRARVTA
jgi:flagellar hook assembly protein FlgD